jgi:hypothetical protein
MKSAPGHSLMKTTCLFVFLVLNSGTILAQSCDPITGTQLKQLLLNMGLTAKQINEAGKPDKFEISNEYSGLTIPVAAEISASTNYIWLTVNLGSVPADSASKGIQLLRQNFAIQPCQFYVTTKNVLMLGFAMENRGMTSAVLRRSLDLVLKRVADSRSYWE